MESDPHHTLPEGPDPTLVIAIKRILRPLVRFLVARQITYPYLIGLLKALYVEVADRDFPMAGKKQTDSRVSLLTGVHRKDVKRLRGEPAERQQVPGNVFIGAQLVARWVGSPRFHDAQGRPRALASRALAAAGEPSFDDLVEEIAHQDIRPRVVLDELLRLDVLQQDQDGLLRLTTGAFTPAKGQEEKLFFFGKNLHDHICAGLHNLEGGRPPFLDRSVYYDKLSPRSLDILAELCQRVGMQALITVNEKALELQTRDQTEPDARHRMNFGVFHYSAASAVPDDETPTQDQARQGTRTDRDD